MNLAVDIGNSSVKFAIFKDTGILDYVSVPTDDFKNGNPDLEKIDFFKKLQGTIETAAISSVVPAINKKCRTALEPFVNGKIYFADQLQLDMKVNYSGLLGEDRKMATYAAGKIYGHSTIVVDVGTALTFSLIDKSGEFSGGMITLGPHWMLKTLAEKTAQLPHIELEFPTENVGKNTLEAINCGVFWSIVGTIQTCVAQIEEFLGDRCKVVMTGGYAVFFAQYIHRVVEIDPFLVLRGVNMVLCDSLNCESRNNE